MVHLSVDEALDVLHVPVPFLGLLIVVNFVHVKLFGLSIVNIDELMVKRFVLFSVLLCELARRVSVDHDEHAKVHHEPDHVPYDKQKVLPLHGMHTEFLQRLSLGYCGVLQIQIYFVFLLHDQTE